jgi:hypothetical protein
MRKLFALALFSLFLVIGCGKKTEPEAAAAPAPGVTADLARLVVIRYDGDGGAEEPIFRGVLTVTNNYAGEITLERVAFSGAAGKVTMPHSLEQLGIGLLPGTSTDLRLDVRFGWKDTAPMNFTKGSIAGTLSYTGPKGKIRELPFELEGELTVRGE